MSTRTRIPATGLSCTAYERSTHMSPNLWTQGTGLSFAGSPTLVPAQVAFGARVIDLPGSPPRGAPV